MKDSDVEFVSIGNIIKETVFYPDTTVGPVLGSPCAYMSVALSRLGKRVGMVSFCSDEWAETNSETFDDIDTTGVMSYYTTTENHLIYHSDGSINVEYFKKTPVIYTEMLPKRYSEAHFFFICPMDFEVSMEICEMLHNKSKCIAVDLGGFGGTTSFIHSPIISRRGKKLIDDLCKYCDIVKASKDDLAYIMPGKSVEECAEYIVSRGPKYVVITLGADGAGYQEKGKQYVHVPAFPRADSETENYIGAGDTFSAGLLAALSENYSDIDYAVHFGNALASLVIEREGMCIPERMPTGDAVKKRTEVYRL